MEDIDAQRKHLLGKMIAERPDPTKFSNSYKSIDDASIKEETEVIKVVSTYVGISLYKIHHPKAFEFSNRNGLYSGLFHDCLPIDAWGKQHCVEIMNITPNGAATLARANSLGQHGLFVRDSKIRWLLESFLCGIPVNYLVYYEGSIGGIDAEPKVGSIAIVDFRVALNEGQWGKMQNDAGIYVALDVWDIIKSASGTSVGGLASSAAQGIS